MSLTPWAPLLVAILVLSGCASNPQASRSDIQGAEQIGNYEVHGAVLHPGSFHLPAGGVLTLAEAIQRSGGFKAVNGWDDGADRDRVHLQRTIHGSVVEYTLRASPGDRDEGFIVRPGDEIFVPKRGFASPIPNPLPFAT